MRILEIINETKKDIKKAKSKSKKNNKKVELSEKQWKALKMMPDFMDFYRKMFTQDTKYKDGFIKKSVKSAFNESKYRKKLNEYVEAKEKNKNSSFEGILKFQNYERLNEDLNNLDEMFNLIQEGLEIIIDDIKLNHTADIDLFALITTLISRLAQLYNIYGYYLEDINGLAEYTVYCNLFEYILRILEEDIFSKLKN